MPEKGYESISLPTRLLDEGRAFLREHPGLGYSSMADFIKAAVRAELDLASGPPGTTPGRLVLEPNREDLENLLRSVIRSEIQGVRSVVVHKDHKELRPTSPSKKASSRRRKP